MKPLLPWLSVVFSVAALCLSTLLYFSADARADAALRRREKAFVARHAAAFGGIYRDMQLVLRPEEKQPETMDDMIRPLLRLMTAVNR